MAAVRMDLPETAAGRLREMGFPTGASVRMVRRAPLGCPIEFEVGGARLALRQADGPKSSCSNFFRCLLIVHSLS